MKTYWEIRTFKGHKMFDSFLVPANRMSKDQAISAARALLAVKLPSDVVVRSFMNRRQGGEERAIDMDIQTDSGREVQMGLDPHASVRLIEREEV
jgi:hypothetical protein